MAQFLPHTQVIEWSDVQQNFDAVDGHVLQTSLNLADVANVTTARKNLGLGQPADGYRNAAFTLTAGAVTVIPIDTMVTDPGGNLDVTTNHRYNVPAAGFYWVAGGVIATSTGSGQKLFCCLLRNGSVFAESNEWSPGGSEDLAPSVSRGVQCSAGDTIQLAAQSAQALVLVVGSAVINFLSVIRVA